MEDDVPSTPACVLRANDVIYLHFEGCGSDCIVTHPTYTHQTFDDEKVIINETGVNDLRVDIYIDIYNLYSRMTISNLPFEDTAKSLQDKLNPLLSPPPEVIPSKPDLGPNLLKTINIGNEVFELYLFKHEDDIAGSLLSRAERVAMWFIETASSVDFNDDKWEVMFMFKKEGDTLSVAGYFTLYSFHNPIVGTKIRVCQALVLPHHQGKGIGRHMLLETYRIASTRSFVAEVTVEDPAEGFQRLRDAVDVEWCMQYARNNDVDIENIVASDVKIIPSQLLFVKQALEFLVLCGISVPRCTSAVNGLKSLTGTKRPLDEGVTDRNSSEINKEDVEKYKPSDQEVYKKFRLKVKKSILQSNGELKGLSKADMQKELSVLYGEMEQRYMSIGKKLGRLIT